MLHCGFRQSAVAEKVALSIIGRSSNRANSVPGGWWVAKTDHKR